MNFLELCQEHNVRFKRHGEHHHTRFGWLQLDCPQCSPDSGRFRLGYNLNKGYATCWTCGHINLTELLHELFGLPWNVCKELKNGLSLSEREERIHHGKLQLPPGRGIMDPAHRRYLERRRLDPDQMSRLWGLQGIGPVGKYKHRIFIPIYRHGEVCSWTTRAVGPSPRRYWGAAQDQESYPAKELVYGIDYVRHAAVVCEGPFDVFAIGPGAVCTLGTAFTRAQVALLAAIPYRYVCYDNEPKAQERARELCELLRPFNGETTNIVLDSKDAADASEERKELRKLLE